MQLQLQHSYMGGVRFSHSVASMAAALLLRLFVVATGGHLPSPASGHPPPPDRHYCGWCPRPSTASLLPPAAAADLINDGGGACGYGATVAAELHGGGGGGRRMIAAAAGAEFFRGGAGCGACYQLRCRDRRACGGVKVVVVDAANRTGFLLPGEAFAAMLSSSDDRRLPTTSLLSDNNVQVDFRRVPCEYTRNLAVQVVEGSSRSPGPLAVRFLYQGGQTDIAAVEVAHQQAGPWRPMSRARLRRGVVVVAAWRAPRAPAGPLQLRVAVTAGVGGKWLRAEGPVLPADRRPGEVHDTGLRVGDVALRSCARACRAAAAGDGGEELSR